ncbi:hypothetical protein [Bradyrhizobium sp. 191]|uniref:hypothetical protein n=1 Tax=Bradyrhizobium sp. 191 TaxID=2782659 RepID=UPI001FFEACCA|nr:hypothetical protein [Bradyrhizobium sp. 191]UPJ68541.1 hypothetical protein IVB23_15525 [Bradyrhizobium sp. 191]
MLNAGSAGPIETTVIELRPLPRERRIGPFPDFAAVGDIGRDCLFKPRLLRYTPEFGRASKKLNTTCAVSVTKTCGPALQAPITTMPQKTMQLFVRLQTTWLADDWLEIR